MTTQKPTPTKGRPPKSGRIIRPACRVENDTELAIIEAMTPAERTWAMCWYRELKWTNDQQAAEISRLTAALQGASQTVHARPLNKEKPNEND